MAAQTAPTLYRAVAYRLQRHDTPAHLQQPEVHVFVEAADSTEAARIIQDGLALAWRCHRLDIEFYNLASEDELMGAAGPGPAEMGDAALLTTGWFHGPLFARSDRVQALVSPLTLARLHRARHLALPWARHQRDAALRASGAGRDQAAASAQQLRERAEAAGLTDLGDLR